MSSAALLLVILAEAPRLRLGVAVEESGGALVITRVLPGSAADRAGVRAGQGLDGMETELLSTREELAAALETYAAAPAVTLHLRPAPIARRLIVPAEGGAGLGLAVRASLHGVVVERVARGSAAERAWLAVGDRITAVDGVSVSSTTAWATRTATRAAGATIALAVRGAPFSVRLLNDDVARTPATVARAPVAASRARLAPPRPFVTQVGFVALAEVGDVAAGGSVGILARMLAGHFPGGEGGGAAAVELGIGAFAGALANSVRGAAMTGVQVDAAMFVGHFSSAVSADEQSGVGLRLGATFRLGRVWAGDQGAAVLELDLTAGLEIARFTDDTSLRSIVLFAGVPVPLQSAGFGGVRLMF